MDKVLSLDNVVAGYDGATIIDGVSLDLPTHGTMALLGRNGMGKSTLLATVMGLTQHMGGRLFLDGNDITSLPTHSRNRAGIGYVPQEREIFPSLTVDQNLQVALRPGHWTLEAAYDLFPRLKERRSNLGSQLSGGEQQMVAVARALLGNPQVLLLDEPFEGLAPIIIDGLADALTRIVGEKTLALILVEHKIDLVLDLVENVTALNRGRVAWKGASGDLKGDTDRIADLLGLGAIEAEAGAA